MMANRMSRQKLNIWVLILVGWLIFSPAGAALFPDIDKLPASFQPEFQPIEPQLRLTGMFTYLADAAVIILCADGRQLPVATENDYISLERAYLQADISPGQPLLVSVDGLITQRPAMEESQPPRPTLVVERFIEVQPHGTCGNPPADMHLCGSRWNLVQLGDTSDYHLSCLLEMNNSRSNSNPLDSSF